MTTAASTPSGQDWVRIDTANDPVPLIIEHGNPPADEAHEWRPATQAEWQRYADYYNALDDEG